MDNTLLNILLFQGGYNTNLVLLCTLILGCGTGMIGSFILLRGRTLISDAVSHASLPGVCVGFLIAFALGIEGGKHLPSMMIGAGVTGFLAALSVQWITKNTRLNQDVAIGTVLSVFYAGGIVLLSYIQRLEGASQAGLDSFLLGQITGITQHEVFMIAGLCLCVLVVTLIYMRDLCLLCFDEIFTRSVGKSIQKLDIILILLMLVIVSAGLKMVGLILILALLITPPVTARFWTNDLKHMLILSAIISALSGYLGAALSAWLPNLPSGGAIVLCAFAFFFISFIAAPERGAIALHTKRTKRT